MKKVLVKIFTTIEDFALIEVPDDSEVNDYVLNHTKEINELRDHKDEIVDLSYECTVLN